MGYVLEKEAFDSILKELGQRYRLYAPVRKKGEGRYTDVDVVRYDFVNSFEEIEFAEKSDYAFKELLTPLSETLFFFTENTVKEADHDTREVLVFLRSCDMHAVKRLDAIYLENKFTDPFYRRVRERVKFVLIGCSHSYEDCFCVDMGSNRTEEGYLFSIDVFGDVVKSDVKDEEIGKLFEKYAEGREKITPAYVTENEVRVSVPENVPNSIYKHEMWDEYTSRCINCGRCNFVCPTCTCYTMQDIFYTDNGRVGERRRVGSSCMVDGYTNVAGGGEYRRTNGERMRFKVLHKVYHFRKRFGYDMCVGCGRCDMVCPEYISYSNCINKLNDAVKEMEGGAAL
ncbi:MAG TPA: anaerobic sulfite reductase subunit A [Lachnospiraceae bacterium]|nr:anaerobic sulfite reductase subunit A [Lachnospiraceae bacterium]